LDRSDENYITQIFRSCGLIESGIVGRNRSYSFYPQPQEELVPIVVPYVQSIRGTKVLTALIGVADIEPSRKNRRYRLLISTLSTNFAGLSTLHEIAKSKPIDLQWCEIVAAVLRDLPTSRAKIEEMVKNRTAIHGVNILDMVHQE
jgi:hypothetical protein